MGWDGGREGFAKIMGVMGGRHDEWMCGLQEEDEDEDEGVHGGIAPVKWVFGEILGQWVGSGER